MRVGYVLYTCAAPNVFCGSDLPSTYVLNISVFESTISDANGRPLNTVGTTALYVRVGVYVPKCHFCEWLSTAYALGGNYLYRFVEAIRPRQRLV